MGVSNFLGALKTALVRSTLLLCAVMLVAVILTRNMGGGFGVGLQLGCVAFLSNLLLWLMATVFKLPV